MSTLQTNDVNESPTRRRDLKRLQRQEKRIGRLHRGNEHDDARNKRQSRKAEEKASRKQVRRLFPIWLRIIVVLVLCYVAMISGLMIGYGVLGSGEPTDALELSTWKHIVNIVVGES